MSGETSPRPGEALTRGPVPLALDRRDLLGGATAAAVLGRIDSAVGATTAPQPFRVEVAEERIAAIRNKVAAFPWAAVADPSGAGDWSYGPPPAWLRGLCGYWSGAYDWRIRERTFNAVPQFVAIVDGLRLGAGAWTSRRPAITPARF